MSYDEHLISMAGGDGEPEATPSGMAAVLTAHYEYNWEPDCESWECQCGHPLGEDVFRRDADPNHRAHQAAMLTAAGFGLVVEAKAEAWDEANHRADEMCLLDEFERKKLRATNPYRAAAVRGES